MPGSKHIVIGADGQLGSDLVKTFDAERDGEIIPLTINDLDIRNHELARKMIANRKPSHVINLAAYHRVDECEDNVGLALEVNAIAAGNLARICREEGAVMAFFSTDYVFSGKQRSPRKETDPSDPLSAYGASKRAGESLVEAWCPRHVIFRTTGLYGSAGCMGKGYNFVEAMISLAKQGKPLKVVNDQVLTPTYTLELAGKVWEVLRTGEYGTFHCTNQGECSWYDFAREIFRQTGLKADISPQTSQELNSKARRPEYSVLAHERLKALGLDTMSPWQAALQKYLKEKRHLPA